MLKKYITCETTISGIFLFIKSTGLLALVRIAAWYAFAFPECIESFGCGGNYDNDSNVVIRQCY